MSGWLINMEGCYGYKEEGWIWVGKVKGFIGFQIPLLLLMLVGCSEVLIGLMGKVVIPLLLIC
jgi:hypothetical protein